MCTDATTKIELPITPNLHIMNYLLKQSIFLNMPQCMLKQGIVLIL